MDVAFFFSFVTVRAYTMACQAHTSHILAPTPPPSPSHPLLSAVSFCTRAVTLCCQSLKLLLCIFHFSAWGTARAATRSGACAHFPPCSAPSHFSCNICEFSYRQNMYSMFCYIKVNALFGTNKFQLRPVRCHATGNKYVSIQFKVYLYLVFLKKQKNRFFLEFRTLTVIRKLKKYHKVDSHQESIFFMLFGHFAYFFSPSSKQIVCPKSCLFFFPLRRV